MKKLSLLLVLLLFKTAAFCGEKWTAQVNITIINFPSLIMEPYIFFNTKKEITVDRTGSNTFSVKYFGSKPKLYYINFYEVLITPGDKINLVYEQLKGSTMADYRYKIKVNGTDTNNYSYFNYLSGRRYLPAILNPDIDLDKFKKNTTLYCNTLKNVYNKWSATTIDSISKFKITDSLKNYLKRKEHFKLLSKFMNVAAYENKKVGQMPVLLDKIDSLFLSTQFVEADTAYAYYSEFVFKNYFSCLIKNRYNNLATEKDFSALEDFIKKYPNVFIKKYFVYFLATDYKNLYSKYNSPYLTEMVTKNPFMERQRYISNNRDNMYWLNDGGNGY